MAEQRLTKGAIAEKVHVLLEVHDVGGEHLQDVLHLGREVRRGHGQEVGLAQVLQALGLGSLHELVEVERLVDLLQVLVEDVAVAGLLDQVQLVLQQGTVGVRGLGHRVGQEGQQILRLLHLDVRLAELPGVIGEHVANHAAEMPARIRVVADVGHAARAELPRADFQDLLLDRRGNPRVHAVANDVVEGPKHRT